MYEHVICVEKIDLHSFYYEHKWKLINWLNVLTKKKY